MMIVPTLTTPTILLILIFILILIMLLILTLILTLLLSYMHPRRGDFVYDVTDVCDVVSGCL